MKVGTKAVERVLMTAGMMAKKMGLEKVATRDTRRVKTTVDKSAKERGEHLGQ